MSPAPRVSILMATYKRPHLLDRSIGSALAQTLSDWELVVVDDGVDEETFRKMTVWEKRDRRIRYFRIPRVGRISIVSNFGLRQARGEYVAILDDDDYWATPEKLEKQVAFLDTHPDFVGCGGGFIVIDEKGREKLRVMKPEHDRDIKRRALLANPMANTTTLFRRAVAEQVGCYDETMPQFADRDFWLKIGLKGRLYNFQEYFAYYQMWSDARSFDSQQANAASALRIVRRYRGDYPGYAKAFLITSLYAFYVRLPGFVRKFSNPALSRLKKVIFSR